MITDFVSKQLKKAKFKILKDGTFFASIPGIKGVWANAKTKTVCQKELQEVLEDWLVVSLKKDKNIPGFNFTFDQRNFMKYA